MGDRYSAIIQQKTGCLQPAAMGWLFGPLHLFSQVLDLPAPLPAVVYPCVLSHVLPLKKLKVK
ncbi:hypothetical protein D3C81_1760070 [compost metagenome]